MSHTGKVHFPQESKAHLQKITEILPHLCHINNLESIIFNVRSQAVYIRLSCIEPCTALVEILLVFAETIERPSASASGEWRNEAFASPGAYKVLSVCISYKATGVFNSEKALKVSSVLVCILFAFSPSSVFFFFLPVLPALSFAC